MAKKMVIGLVHTTNADLKDLTVLLLQVAVCNIKGQLRSQLSRFHFF